MATSPSTDNYTLGKGVVYFNKKDQSSGLYLGYRDLGNAPAFSFSVALEKLEHYSSRGGLRAKDKEIISQISPTVSFTLDEVNADNLALLTLGTITSMTQTAGFANAEVVSSAHLGMRHDLAYREVGSYIISHGAVTGGPFQAEEAVTSDNADPGTGTILAVGTDQLVILVESGTFATGDGLTGGTSSATATMDADPVFNPGVIYVQDDSDTTTYVAGTDYEVSTALRDDEIGRIKFLTGGSITEGDDIHVSYNYNDATYSKIDALLETQLEGELRFVSDNPAGGQQEITIWRVSLSPSGDTAMIGEDWSTLSFTGEVLKDESGHPTTPYMEIIVE